jgi:MSHA biogenesis protein MshP
MRRQSTRRLRNRLHGLGAVAVIVILVVLAALAAAVLRLGQQSQSMTEQDVMGARASLAARAGIEWGLYQAFKGSWTTCSAASQTLDLSADMAGLRVTVACDSTVYNEGLDSSGNPLQVRVFTVDAVACTSSSPSTACPDASASQRGGYVEHRRQAQAVN